MERRPNALSIFKTRRTTFINLLPYRFTLCSDHMTEAAHEEKSYANDPANSALSNDEKIQLYRDMVRIRKFEETSLKIYSQQGKIGGFLHLYIGQESLAVGAVSLMGENDHIITAYRDHGHALAVGMSMNECMAELYGKATGCSKGKGGSMHYFAPDKNYWGGHGIVGGQTPLGTGLAFALKYKGLKGCALCFLGDGAINQGAYHESLNLAALWDLPVIFIIENNGYSMGTSQSRSSAHPEGGLAQRAEGYGIEWDSFEGADIYQMRARTKIAMDRAKETSRPSVLEVCTYRYQGHSVADAKHKDGYRTKDEIEAQKGLNDPITRFKNQLVEEGILNDDISKQIRDEAKKETDASVQFAEESPFPEVSAITEDVYYEVDHNTEAGQTGRHFFH